jgi:hypothetical protein
MELENRARVFGGSVGLRHEDASERATVVAGGPTVLYELSVEKKLRPARWEYWFSFAPRKG